MAAVTSTSTSLRRYALTRLALMLPMAWILMTLVFLLMRVAPGDPISAALGGRLTQEELAEPSCTRPASTDRSSSSTSSTSATSFASTSAAPSSTTGR